MPNTIERDTGLTPHQQRERATVARGWAWRVLWIDKVSACGVRLALRAVEAAEAEAQDQEEIAALLARPVAAPVREVRWPMREGERE